MRQGLVEQLDEIFFFSFGHSSRPQRSAISPQQSSRSVGAVEGGRDGRVATEGDRFDAASRGGDWMNECSLADSFFCFSLPLRSASRRPCSPPFFVSSSAMSGGDDHRHLHTSLPSQQSSLSPAASPSAAAAAHNQFILSRRLGDLVDVADAAGLWTGRDGHRDERQGDTGDEDGRRKRSHSL